MIKLNMPVVVEGKYDKITLENVIDTTIISTDGFGIFKNKDKVRLIRRLAEKNGIIIMTDSDSAGSVIRGYLKNILGDAKIINIYLPQILGKEKRKNSPSKEGFLGVEGMTPQVIKEALEKYGIVNVKERDSVKITKTDLFVAGLSGAKDSSLKRESFLGFIQLPKGLTTPALLDALNSIYTLEEFKEKILLWQKHTDKN